MVEASELRVLLVDDDPAVMRAHASVFVHNGVTVDTAANGQDAIERVKVTSFDVIISDISMPKMTGI